MQFLSPRPVVDFIHHFISSEFRSAKLSKDRWRLQAPFNWSLPELLVDDKFVAPVVSMFNCVGQVVVVAKVDTTIPGTKTLNLSEWDMG